MLRVLLFLATVLGVADTAKQFARLKDFKNRPAWKRLLTSLDQGVYATCELVFFTEPLNYADAGQSCKDFQIGSAGRRGHLATLDTRLKNSNLMMLHDVAYPGNTTDETKWSWTGLQKVRNNDVIYKARQMKKKRQVIKAYDVSDWEWEGTGESPAEYERWPRQRKYSRPDQVYLSDNKKGQKQGCLEEGGCFQNQVKVSQENSFWEDSWSFETHPYACDYQGKYILSTIKQTWVKAKKMCEKAGLELAMVKSPEDARELKQAIEFFLGDAGELKEWSNSNWFWLGGNDLEEEGVWKWLNGDLVETWELPWKAKAGNDNASFLKKEDGQHALAFSRDGKFDDSFENSRYKKRGFVCQCPEA